ncbi:MAG: hypothetical protein MUC87_04505 [Bacteroidia bacterium]|jgi:hypothetical protein|nr:hypothetical protein [Bacteroidia bacterium]
MRLFITLTLVGLFNFYSGNLRGQISVDSSLSQYISKNSTFTLKTISITSSNCGYYSEESPPDSADSVNVAKYSYLKSTKPTKKNYSQYYSTAISLVRFKDSAAGKMLLNILESPLEEYGETYYHFPDGKTKRSKRKLTLYGYGGFTSNYKHFAALNLMKLELNRNNPQLALSYLQRADTLYRISYSCGTGFMMFKSEMECYYAECYYRLKRYNEVLAIYLPYCIYSWPEIADSSIRKLFNQTQIDSLLLTALNSLTVAPDTIQYREIRHFTNDSGNWEGDTTYYYTLNASFVFLDNKISFRPELYYIPEINGVRTATKESAIRQLRESRLFSSLRS